MAFVPDKPTGRFVPDSASTTSPIDGTVGDMIGSVVQSVTEPVTSMATGVAGAAVGGIAGLAGSVLPGPPGQGADVARRISNAMTYEPRTRGGKAVLNAVSTPFEWLAGKADRAGGATAEATGSPLAGAAVNTAIQSLPLVGGGVVSRVAGGGESAASLAARTAAESKAAPMTANIAKAKDAGLILPPSMVNPNSWNMLEGLAGKRKTEQKASQSNIEMYNTLVKKGLGVPDEVPLSSSVYSDIRATAGKSYEAVKNIGSIPVDAEYVAALDAIDAANKSAAKSFPGRSDPISDMVKRLKNPIDNGAKGAFDASAAIDEVKLLRRDADAAYATRNPAVGRANKQAAVAIEDMIDRHLAATGAPADMLTNLRDARKIIAKSYTAQAATNETTGNIIPRKLAAQLQKGKPLEGDIRTAAELARAFPKASQEVERIGGVTAVSPLDAAASGIAAVTGGRYEILGSILGRPVVRGTILSKPYQNAFVNAPTFGRSKLDVMREMAARSAPAVGLAALQQRSK